MEEIINLDGGNIDDTTLKSDSGVELLINDTRRKSKECSTNFGFQIAIQIPINLAKKVYVS